MARILARPVQKRLLAALLLLLVLAVAGTTIYLIGLRGVILGVDQVPPPIPNREDFISIPLVVDAVLHGRSVEAVYANSPWSQYPLPFYVLLFPVALPGLGGLLARVTLVAVILAAGLVMFAGGRNRDPKTTAALVAPAILSLAFIQAVDYDQISSAVAFGAICLAIWGQRTSRWYVVGPALVVAAMRPTNGLVVIAMIVAAIGWRPAALVRVLAGATIALGVLSEVAFLWDANWIADYVFAARLYSPAGPLRLVELRWGIPGILALQLLLMAFAVLYVRKSSGRPLDLDRASGLLALTVLATPLPGVYPGFFTLPALVRLGMRPGLSLAPAIAGMVSWLVVIALSGELLGPRPEVVYATSALLAWWYLPWLYPVFRWQGPSDVEDRGRVATPRRATTLL